MPCRRARRPRISAPRCRSLLSVGWVTALGWTVVSMVTRSKCFGSAAPARSACGGERLGEEQLEPLGADALAPACHRGAVERHGVLEVGLAAEELDVRAVEEARAGGLVREAVHVFDQVQPDHEAGRQPGPAALAVERAEAGCEAPPVDE